MSDNSEKNAFGHTRLDGAFARQVGVQRPDNNADYYRQYRSADAFRACIADNGYRLNQRYDNEIALFTSNTREQVPVAAIGLTVSCYYSYRTAEDIRGYERALASHRRAPEAIEWPMPWSRETRQNEQGLIVLTQDYLMYCRDSFTQENECAAWGSQVKASFTACLLEDLMQESLPWALTSQGVNRKYDTRVPHTTQRDIWEIDLVNNVDHKRFFQAAGLYTPPPPPPPRPAL